MTKVKFGRSSIIRSRIALLLSFGAVLPNLWGSEGLADGNRIYLLQLNATPVSGNTLRIDQSSAVQSTIRGHPNVVANPLTGESFATQNALQLGSGNVALIDQAGVSNTALLTQHGGRARGNLQPGLGNFASISLSGTFQSASLIQEGNLNTALLTVESGHGTNGRIRQRGNLNSATTNILGPGVSGVFHQVGNGLSGGLKVHRSSPGTQVTYTLVGNNLTTSRPLRIASNSGANDVIHVTQYR